MLCCVFTIEYACWLKRCYLYYPLTCIIHVATGEFGFYVFIYSVSREYMFNSKMTDCLFDARANNAQTDPVDQKPGQKHINTPAKANQSWGCGQQSHRDSEHVCKFPSFLRRCGLIAPEPYGCPPRFPANVLQTSGEMNGNLPAL